TADQSPRILRDQNLIRPRERLRPCREVRGVPDHCLLLGSSRADQVADYRNPRRQPDAHLQRLRRSHPSHFLHSSKAGPHGPLGGVLMRLWVAEIGEDPVARYFATNPSNRSITSATHFWYAPITSRKSSESSREASAVEPTKSQNITVSWRRSPTCADSPAPTPAPAHRASSEPNLPIPRITPP